MFKLIKKTFQLAENIVDTGISACSKATTVVDDIGDICTELSGTALSATQQGCAALNSELAVAILENEKDRD